MPTLPDFTSLGQPTQPQADRPIASYQGGIAQQGQAAIGGALASAGQTAEKTGDALLDAQDRLSYAAGVQGFLAKNLDIRQRALNDPDYTTAPQRYSAELQKAVAESSSSIRNPVLRAQFTASMARIVNGTQDSILTHANTQAKEVGRGNTIEAINTGVDQALSTDDDALRTAALQAVHDRIDAAAASGYFTPAEAAKLKRTVPQQFATKRATMMMDADPSSAVKALAPTGMGQDGTPTFEKTGDWRDFLDPAKRMDLYRAAEQRQTVIEQKNEVEAERQQRLADKQKRDNAEAAANDYVTQLIKDPTQVDTNAIANDSRLTPPQKLELARVAQSAISQSGDARDAKTYGSGFFDLFQRIHAPADDPTKITDPSQLYQHVGPNGDLTVSGLDKLTQEIQGRRTPEGEAEAQMKKVFFTNARAQITGTNDGLHIRDPKGDELYLKFLATALPAYDQGRKDGKTPAQLLNPDSPDYIGKSIATFKRPMAEWTRDMIESTGLSGAAPAAAGGQAPDLSTPQGLVAAYQSGHLTRDEAEKIALQKGFIGKPADTGPMPPVAR